LAEGSSLDQSPSEWSARGEPAMLPPSFSVGSGTMPVSALRIGTMPAVCKVQ
jgi:hypothetical protein